jgi:hypothetical protein
MRRPILSGVVALSAALILSSCAMPADDPNFVEGADLIDEEFEADPEVDADFLAEALVTPTSIGVDIPLAAPPEAGTLIVSLSDGSEFDTLLNASISEAAIAIGWEFAEVTGAESLESAPAAFEEALALNPAGIRISGDYVDALEIQLAEAENAGVAVICTGCSGEPIGAIKDTSIDGDAQNTVWGQILSSYIIENQSAEEVAGIEVFALPAPALLTFNLEFADNMENLCRDCSVIETIVDVNDLEFAPTLIADTMSTSLGRWAVLDSGEISTDVPAALADALVFEPIVLIGRGANARDIAIMQELAASGAVPPEKGTIDASPEAALALQAWTGLPVPVMGWRVIDQFARILAGEALADGSLPSQLLTVTNVAEAALDESGNYLGVADYREQFTGLWGVN